MPIRSEDGTAEIIPDSVVYVGSTTPIEVLSFEPGSNVAFKFRPCTEDNGTLILDYAYDSLRHVLSPQLYRYWWEHDKLVVRKGIHRMGLEVHTSTTFGFWVKDPEDQGGFVTTFITHTSKNGQGVYRAKLVDLLQYAEGKILKQLLISRAVKMF